jgi:hypothetical protein
MANERRKKFLVVLMISICCAFITGYSTFYTFKAYIGFKLDSTETSAEEHKKAGTEKSENLFFHEPIFMEFVVLGRERPSLAKEPRLKLPSLHYTPIKPPPDFS